MSADKKIRKRGPSFTAIELRNFYEYVGAEIGRCEAAGVLQDKALSEIRMDTEPLRATQDKIFEALNGKAEASKEKS